MPDCPECGNRMRDQDSGHHACLYCRLPDRDAMTRAMIALSLRDLPEENARGSRDFGRGYMSAINDACDVVERKR